MKNRAMVIAVSIGLLSMAPAYATDYDFSGNLTYHNDIRYWDVTTGAGSVTVFTSSWIDGNFDPMLQVWDLTTGVLLAQQDDGHVIGTTVSNGVAYATGDWDTYYSLDLGAGTYRLSMSTYFNWANGTNWSDPQWEYAADTPIPIADWDQPSNGVRRSSYEVHFLNATAVIPDDNQVPEPATLALLGLGLAGLGFTRRKKA